MNTKNIDYIFHREILEKNIRMAYGTNCNLISICCGDSDFVMECLKSCGIRIYDLNSISGAKEFSNEQLNICNKDSEKGGEEKAIFIEHSRNNDEYFYNLAQRFVEKLQDPFIKFITVFKEKEINDDLIRTFIDDHYYVIYSNQKIKMKGDEIIKLMTTKSGIDKIKIIHPALFKAINYIVNNIHEDISLDQVSNASYVSSSHLSYLFRTKLNTNFKHIVFILKVIEAREEIRSNPNKNLTEVALDLGFYDLSHFGKVFKKYEGKSIGEFRRDVNEVG